MCAQREITQTVEGWDLCSLLEIKLHIRFELFMKAEKLCRVQSSTDIKGTEKHALVQACLNTTSNNIIIESAELHYIK